MCLLFVKFKITCGYQYAIERYTQSSLSCTTIQNFCLMYFWVSGQHAPNQLGLGTDCPPVFVNFLVVLSVGQSIRLMTVLLPPWGR